MSKSNPPRRRRSLRIVAALFKFIFMLIIVFMVFIVSFGATLIIKNNDLHDEENVSDTPIRSGVPEIKTLFDERNKQPFRLTSPDENPPADKKSASLEDRKVEPVAEAAPDNQPPPTRYAEDDTGLVDKFSRVTAIKPAVDDKINSMPNYVTLDKMPYILTQAVVAVEDTRFYDHKGFDVIGIARAVFVNAKAGEIQEGASTITQQTIKNLFLTSDRTFARKFEELILSVSLEKNFDKDKIMELYLNSIYFGSNFYGIYDAAHGYFNKEPADLTIAECAMLAGLPNAPSLYSPYVDFRSAKKRQLVVIDAMEKMGAISSREAESARIENLTFAR